MRKMAYSTGWIYFIYIVTFVIAFIILRWLASSMRRICSTYGNGSIFFLASIIALIAGLIGAAFLDYNTLTTQEQTWLWVLLGIAIAIPVLALFYIIWKREYKGMFGQYNSCGSPCPAPCPKPACPTPCPKPACPTPCPKPACPTPCPKPACPTPCPKPACPTPCAKTSCPRPCN